MNCLSLIALILLVTCQVTVSQDALSTEQARASLLLSALCVEESGQISQDCLNGLSSRNLFRSLLPALQPRLEGLSSKTDSNGKLGLPAKRGREENSGFYSNW